MLSLSLGHRITREGIATDPAKTAVVQKRAVPQTTQELEGFLGLVGYYRKYVSGFAGIAKPLYRLTEKGRECGRRNVVLSRENGLFFCLFI